MQVQKPKVKKKLKEYKYYDRLIDLSQDLSVNYPRCEIRVALGNRPGAKYVGKFDKMPGLGVYVGCIDELFPMDCFFFPLKIEEDKIYLGKCNNAYKVFKPLEKLGRDFDIEDLLECLVSRSWTKRAGDTPSQESLGQQHISEWL